MHDLIKQKQPLILNITNNVTMDIIANGLLSVGASPLMSTAPEEMDALITLAQIVVINIGTLNEPFIKLCHQACTIANQLNKPVILDPVGVGASDYRTHTALALLNKYAIAIIRGNASEIISLANNAHKTKGVDSLDHSQNAIESARYLSEKYNLTVVITGKTDFIIDHDKLAQCEHGTPLLKTITGAGCLLTAIIGAFHAVENNRFEASRAATIFYGQAAERAEKHAQGPGTFRLHFMDALHEN